MYVSLTTCQLFWYNNSIFDVQLNPFGAVPQYCHSPTNLAVIESVIESIHY